MLRWLGYPILREALDELQKEFVDLVGVAEELLVLPEGHVLHPGEGVVQESPATGCQLHILAEDLYHVLKIAVVVGETLPEDNEVGDVGDGIGHEMLGVKGLSLMLVNGIEKKQALLRNPLKHPLTAAKVAEAVHSQFVVFNPASTVFAVQKA